MLDWAAYKDFSDKTDCDVTSALHRIGCVITASTALFFLATVRRG